MVLTPVGLHKDTAVHAFDVTKACDAQNIRFTSTGEELSEGCISNEKSNSKTFILPRNIDNKEYNIEGTILGIHVLHDFVIIFSHLEDNLDAIYKIKYANEDQFIRNNGCGVITGNFNFNTSYPIECLGIIENNNIKRVYWVDGLNQPRSINIETAFKKDNDGNINNPENKVDSTIFDFKPDLYTWLLVNIKIEKSEVGGIFPAGVIQYVVTSVNENNQESSVVYQSPLYYTSENGRGLSGEQLSNNSFRITIEAIPANKKFKVYRIVHTSINNFSVYDLGNYNVSENSESYTPSIAIENGPCNIPSYNPIKSWDINGSRDFGEELLNNSTFIPKDGYYGWWVVNTKDSEKVNTITLLDGYFFSSREEGDNSGIDRIAVYTGGNIGSRYRDIKKVIFWSKFNTGLEFENIVSPITNDIDSDLDISRLGLSPQFPEEEYFKYNITILDTGKEGTIVDNTYLKFLNTEPISPYTLCQKDNTLFFGNYKLLLNNFTDKFKSDIKNNSTKEFFLEECTTKSDNIEDLNNQYYFLSTLDNNSSENTYFHYGELYRFGVQFLHKTGYWSEVVYIGDEKNEVRVVPNKYNDALASKPLFKVSIPAEYLPQDEGYIGARLVVVYPESYNRSVLYQGIFFPTVFNVEDRIDNFPYAQPDWFSRYEYFNLVNANPSGESLAAEMNAKRGQPLFNRIGEFIPGGRELNSELQYEGYLEHPTVDDYKLTTQARKALIEKRYSGFCIDKNIMTFYSPELTFDDQSLNTKLNDAKIRIIGYVVPKTNFSKIDVTSGNIFDTIDGGFKELNIEDRSKGLSGTNISWHISNNQLTNHALWIDSIAKTNDSDVPPTLLDYRVLASFPIYPWQRSGSLNNMNSLAKEGLSRKSVLEKKKLSNLKICLSPVYLDSALNIEPERLSNIEICDAELAEDSSIIKLDLGLEEKVIYKSNINKVLLSSVDATAKVDSSEYFGETLFYNKVHAITSTAYADSSVIQSLQQISNEQYSKIDSLTGNIIGEGVNIIHTYSKDPIHMSYKTTRHLVFGLKHTKELISDSESSTRYYRMGVPLFPTLGDMESTHAENGYIWDKPEQITYYDVEKTTFNGTPILNSKVYYPVGEVYRDVVNPFNGTSKETLSAHSWIPCSDTILFSEVKNNLLEIKANRGDTYFQRFDCLKTYARTPEDENQIVDIISFPCETRINIDGRYDKNRGLKDNTNISPQNFNLLNDVYSQKENYFTYSYLDADDVKGTTFNNQILWSKTKVSGEKIDTWGSISPVNSMDLDGQKGTVNALRTYKNNIYCFQDCGISVIDFNSRVQIPTSDGVPIEISNSGKVTGKMYLSDKYGCQNKWSMAETNNGIYFADGYNKGIVLFNGKDTLDLSKSLFVNSVFSGLNLYKKWTPGWFDSIRTHYNSIDQDVYFTTKDFCLSYNEKAQSFTSFYSYEKVPYAFNVKGNYYQLKDNNLWRLHGGSDYNNFFGVDKDFSVSVIANADYLMDKVFENVELRTDDTLSFDIGNTTTDIKPFSELITENEYQKAVRDTSKLRKKFRVWRWPIGKDSNRDRIRNMWSKITIKGNKDYKKRLKLSSILVDYYI